MKVTAEGFFPETVPLRWVKFVIAVFLLPVMWVLTKAFLNVFAGAAWQGVASLSMETISFFGGLLLWWFIFLTLPRPTWLYVFGHELTHALWVVLSRGRVHEFRVSREGGHVVTNKTGTLIALAPYFFPIYSILFIAVYGYVTWLWKDFAAWRMAPMVLYAGVGITWSFHFTFTCWMIPKGQADLEYGGYFFSLAIIYIINLLCLATMLLVVLPGATFMEFGRSLFENGIVLVSLLSECARKIFLLVRWES